MILGYLSLFFGGAFLCNAIPHLAAGLRGEPFPTPFATPRGIGNSSAFLNFLWGSANLAISVYLMSHNYDDNLPHGMWITTFGFLGIGAYLSLHFGKHRG